MWDVIKDYRLPVGVFVCALAAFLWARDWQMGTFVTRAEAGEISLALQNHMTEEQIYRLQANLNDAEDKAWALEQQIQSDGNSIERQDKLREYNRRSTNIRQQIECVRAEKRNCTVGQ